MSRWVFEAVVPVELEVGDATGGLRDESRAVVREVLAGEYDAPYTGERLTILDLGANVGAFALWAGMRWPDSTVVAYEPDPEAFELLRRNVDGRAGVRCVNAAVYPSEASTSPFVRRTGGDTQAALAPVASDFLVEASSEHVIEVATVHPRSLPPADIVKLDVEGAEAEILAHLDLGRVSLIMLEYHDRERRAAIERMTAGTFAVERRSASSWAPYMDDRRYRRRLQDDEFGLLVLVNRRMERLRRMPASRVSTAAPTSLRQACAPLPGLLGAAVRRRSAALRTHLGRVRR